MATEYTDVDYAETHPEGFPDGSELGWAAPTKCAHIFPVWANDFESVDDPTAKVRITIKTGIVLSVTFGQHAWSNAVWTMLDHFGYSHIKEEIKGSGTHSLSNVMTLRYDLHDMFYELDLWFEAVDGKVIIGVPIWLAC